MKLNLRAISTALLIAATTTGFAQFTEDFEGGQGQSTKEMLKQQNWAFSDMNVETYSPISGHQSFITGLEYSADQVTGLATPFLTFNGKETLKFSYKLHRSGSLPCRRWFLVNVVNTQGVLTQIDSVEMEITDASVNIYSAEIENLTGPHSIYINFRGNGYSPQYIVDDIYFSGDDAGIGYPVYEAMSSPFVIAGLESAEQAPTNALKMTPNPAKSDVNLFILSNKPQAATVEVANMNGAILMTIPTQLIRGTTTVTFSVANLIPGTYVVTVKTDSWKSAARLSRVP
ncbi:MAG: T9SS type A sorting domain-containing protein [Chitinophagales bacterium]|nr:T9SS type A sorting domain-containing protein [Chitinophagales bacterium]